MESRGAYYPPYNWSPDEAARAPSRIWMAVQEGGSAPWKTLPFGLPGRFRSASMELPASWYIMYLSGYYRVY